MAFEDITIEISDKELLAALPHPFAVRHLDPEQLKWFIEFVRQNLIKRKRLQNV